MSKVEASSKRPKTGGRKKGTPNKTTLIAKEAIALAADRLGGVDRLVVWAKEDTQNERAFWATIYTKLLPLQVDANLNGKLVSEVTHKIVDGHA